MKTDTGGMMTAPGSVPISHIANIDGSHFPANDGAAASFSTRQAPPAPLHYQTVRDASMAIAAPLSPEDCCAQSMPDASPIKWHLAHTTWFFETFILEAHEPGFTPHHPAFRVLFNSYYNGIGDKYPRARRGLLTRPSLDEVKRYRQAVDARMTALLQGGVDGQLAALLELGLQHEQQHQELMQTDIKHLLAQNYLQPAYRPAPEWPASKMEEPPLEWIAFDGGVTRIGHQGEGFCFDNELPRHRHYLEPYSLASRLVSNAEYLAFIEAGGYDDPACWLAEGWDWVCSQRQQSVQSLPLYWEKNAQGWQQFTLHGLQPLALQQAAVHLNYYEADAYARWAGARLPTEAEWEHAASATPGRIAHLFDTAWQWTSSSYTAYPGYRANPGAIGEYNGKFMVNQYVLRGASCATPAGHARETYRNFFPAGARWQFSGIRLAKSL